MPNDQGVSPNAIGGQSAVWLVLTIGQLSSVVAAFWEQADAAAHAALLSTPNPGDSVVLREVVPSALAIDVCVNGSILGRLFAALIARCRAVACGLADRAFSAWPMADEPDTCRLSGYAQLVSAGR